MTQSAKPYQNDALNIIYNLLFCDDISVYKQGNTGQDYPWNVLFSDETDIMALNKIATDSSVEARVQLLAFNKLATAGHLTEEKKLLGVIIEVALEDGLDVLAAYADGSARYINYSEKLIVLESPTETSKQLTNDLFAKSVDVVNKIGPWDKPRLPFPTNGTVRLTFLVSDGLYFGQGPFDILAEDAMGGPVIQSATYIMQYLTQMA